MRQFLAVLPTVHRIGCFLQIAVQDFSSYDAVLGVPRDIQSSVCSSDGSFLKVEQHLSCFLLQQLFSQWTKEVVVHQTKEMSATRPQSTQMFLSHNRCPLDFVKKASTQNHSSPSFLSHTSFLFFKKSLSKVLSSSVMPVVFFAVAAKANSSSTIYKGQKS